MVEDKLAALKHDLHIPAGQQFHWAKQLPRLMYTLNTQTSETTKDTPYNLVFGQAPNRLELRNMSLSETYKFLFGEKW